MSASRCGGRGPGLCGAPLWVRGPLRGPGDEGSAFVALLFSRCAPLRGCSLSLEVAVSGAAGWRPAVGRAWADGARSHSSLRRSGGDSRWACSGSGAGKGPRRTCSGAATDLVGSRCAFVAVRLGRGGGTVLLRWGSRLSRWWAMGGFGELLWQRHARSNPMLRMNSTHRRMGSFGRFGGRRRPAFSSSWWLRSACTSRCSTIRSERSGRGRAQVRTAMGRWPERRQPCTPTFHPRPPLCTCPCPLR